jgi:lysozyme
MDVINLAKDSLKRHEGYRQFVYKCTAGKETIAFGRNLADRGIKLGEAEYLLENDIVECLTDLASLIKRWHQLSEYAQAALIDLRFNLGPSGFRSFKKTIAAVEDGDMKLAALNVLDSKYHDQVGRRAEDIAAWLTK